MKILTILGARPQFIKAGSVSREILKQKKSGVDIDEVIIHTGQHYDLNMSDVFFKEMNIPKPDFLLGIGNKSHGSMTGQMIEKIEEITVNESPDWVLVYGDTNSTLAGAISASKLNIKIAHVEAGLRSFNMKMPEEINRILTDRISSLLFCPTQAAMENLKNEGFDNFNTKIIMSGDVMKDGAIFYKNIAKRPKGIMVDSCAFVLCTIHRAENTDNPKRLTSIVNAFNTIALTTQVILPLHPRTKKILSTMGCKLSDKIIVTEPVGYLNMVWLISNCSLVMTDSGGLQKEAYFFSKPCITLREETEWVELLNEKVNILAGSNSNEIIHIFNTMPFSLNFSKHKLYGNGNASSVIVKELLA